MPRPIDPHAKIELLRAAEAVFVEHGLEGARVEEITARAGRSKGSFYLHFASKEEAFRQIVESMIARLASFLDSMEVEQTEVSAADLREVLDLWLAREVELFEFLWQNRRLVRLVMRGGGSERFGFLIDAFADRARERTKGFLQMWIERGAYRPDLDVDLASLAISGAYDRLARELVRLEKKPDLVSWIRGLQRIFLIGIGEPAVRDVLDPPVTQSLVGLRGTGEPAPRSTASTPATVIPARRSARRTSA
jgi:AcrR family transcriptional regulator